MWSSIGLQATLLSAIAAAQSSSFRVPTTKDEAMTGRPGDGYLTFSIEFATFPDYAGNLSSPNEFSHNLMNNLAEFAGKKMYIRVGGNTQDMYTYNSSLKVALQGDYNLDRSRDYPTDNMQIGPVFFEAYKTWPGYTFSHGLNMGGNNNPNAWKSLLETAEAACTLMGADVIETWEYGNEPNGYPNAAKYAVRDKNFRDERYVQEWLNGTRAVQKVVEEHCPEQAGEAFQGWMAPSTINIQIMTRPEYADNEDRIVLDFAKLWALGQNETANVVQYGLHNYIDNALGPVTLSGTLLNHTRMRLSADYVFDLYDKVETDLPLILSEHNSVALQGSPGLSNAFGAALWTVDMNIYAASRGVHRSHMHTGTNYRYQPWQPIDTERVVKGTKAPYYGQIAVAAFIGDNSQTPVDVAHLSLGSEDGSDEENIWDVAYAAYEEDRLARVMLINMREYNYTGHGSNQTSSTSRGSREFRLDLGLEDGSEVMVKRLHANGSDAITGISFNGWSYNYELDNGKPVRLDNVTTDETVMVSDGSISVELQDSEAVLLDFGGGSDGNSEQPGTVEGTAVTILLQPLTLVLSMVAAALLL